MIRGDHTLDEVDAIFSGPTFQNFPISGAGDVLHREVPGSVVTNRIDRDPIAFVEATVGSFDGAQNHRVTDSGGQQIVDLDAHDLVAAYAAAGFDMEPVDAWGLSQVTVNTLTTPAAGYERVRKNSAWPG